MYRCLLIKGPTDRHACIVNMQLQIIQPKLLELDL
uniref:Cytochrome b6/f complex subunit V n=1 Tax=Ageratum conyzoides TaxID=68299 RepID=A0A6B9IT24_AGECN|nr:cytochrome b6/f complex subunit V [Ageratum conyzoides]